MIYKKPHAHGTYICTKEMPLEITQGKSTCILLIQYCNIKKIQGVPKQADIFKPLI